MRHLMLLTTMRAEEYVADLPRHIKRRENCCDDTQIKWPRSNRPFVAGMQNGIFTPEPCEQWKPAQCQHSRSIRHECDRHALLQASHEADRSEERRVGKACR